VIGPNRGFTTPEANVMDLAYYTTADQIAGWVEALFPEKYEIVKTVTDGAGTPDAATHRFDRRLLDS
jgi:hypothetical protein